MRKCNTYIITYGKNIHINSAKLFYLVKNNIIKK